MNITKITVLISVIGAAAVLLSACQYGSQSTSIPANSKNGNTTNQPTTNAVTIQNMAFTPQDLQVKVGQKVTWTNQDQLNHTTTSDTGVFDSENVASGNTFSYTFTKAGIYTYHCSIHTSMKAQVTVTQ